LARVEGVCLQIAKFSNLRERVKSRCISRVGIGHHVWGHM